MAKSDLRQLALLGAQARIQQLQAEVQEILTMFPQLRSGTRTKLSPPTDSGRKKRQFSAKGKKAISEGMRKYWARRRAKTATKSGRATQASE
jgi:hypothetical protein